MRDFSIRNISGFYHIATGAVVIDKRRSLNRKSFPKNKRRREAPLFIFAVIILPTQKNQQTQNRE
jgi:hypothetical protein